LLTGQRDLVPSEGKAHHVAARTEALNPESALARIAMAGASVWAGGTDRQPAMCVGAGAGRGEGTSDRNLFRFGSIRNDYAGESVLNVGWA
jgi:hypothetical protein